MRIALPLFCLILLLAIFPQTIHAQQLPVHAEGSAVIPMLPHPSPLPELNPPAASSQPFAVDRVEEVNIGVTRFEIQSIGSLGRRIAVSPTGTVSAAWHFGDDQAGGWPDRGTGYNENDGLIWGAAPNFSVETTRSGYPSFANTADGTEVILSHKNTTASDWFLQTLTKMPGETTWTEMDIPSSVPGGPVWGKIATGGPDGNSLHVIATSVNPMFGGSNYEGMDQHPLYFRSTDAGATWDITDGIIPGLDSSFYSVVSGEAHNIYANGSTIAIAVFESWGDIAVFKSLDNGDTWEKSIILDFPLDKYDDLGYEPSDIPTDPNAPDSVSIFTADGSGSVLVDDDGKVHVFFSTIYVFATLADRFLNLSTEGIAYWNEDRETGDIDIIAGAVDFDGDGMVTVNGTFAQLRYNNTNLTSFPTTSIDNDGNLYLVYTAVREDLIDPDLLTFRHIYISKSSDGGDTWSDPIDMLDPETFELYSFIEGMYPSIPARIGEQIDLVYVQDLIPGLTPAGSTTNDHAVLHVIYDKETLAQVSSAEEIEQLTGAVALVPNPAEELTAMQFQLNNAAKVSFRIYDVLGSLIGMEKNLQLAQGNQSVNLDIAQLNNGVYFVQMEIEGKQLTKKLVVGE